LAGTVVVVAGSVVVVVVVVVVDAASEVVVAFSVVVVALVVVVVATSVVLADLLSLLHAAATPTRANAPNAAPKRRPAARRKGCRDRCAGVFDRGEYMVIATSK
jgi:hypothetical protein